MATQHTHHITQSELATQLGIPVEDLKKCRAELGLMPGEDWLPGSPVRFTETGVKKVRAALQLPEESADAGTEAPEAPAKKTAGPEPVVRVELVVVQVVRGTRQLVHCRDPRGEKVRLRVRDNSKFVPGMRVPRCVRTRLDARLYDLEGRLPRWKGRF